jgi:hypothetical protein
MGACAGGAAVTKICAHGSATPAAFASCAGAAGQMSCPYCIDLSCFDPRLCTTAADCHREDACTQGLCIAASPCATTVAIADVVMGAYPAGKEVCVEGAVSTVRSGTDGLYEIAIGSTPTLYVDVMEMYRAAGVQLPSAGQTVRAHGMVRWDQEHADWELMPVDWIGP